MKGFKPIWIIVTLILALGILVMMIMLADKGRGTAEDTFSQTDLINCCNNCCITQDPATTTCPGDVPLTGEGSIAEGLSMTISSCTDIPFCGC